MSLGYIISFLNELNSSEYWCISLRASAFLSKKKKVQLGRTAKIATLICFFFCTWRYLLNCMQRGKPISRRCGVIWPVIRLARKLTSATIEAHVILLARALSLQSQSEIYHTISMIIYKLHSIMDDMHHV